MSVEINIHTRKCTVKKNNGKMQSECVNMSEEKLIEIQAEAYYRALKRIEEEKEEAVKEKVVEKHKFTFGERVGYIFNVLVFPWKINKRFKLNGIYDSLLVLIISSILKIVGSLMWGAGVVIIINAIVPFVPNASIDICYGILPILFGSIGIISGSEFEKETDSNKIYAYSGAIIAIISCIVSIVAIFVSKQ